MNEKGVKRLVLNAGIFAAAMILTFLCVFWKQDLEKIMGAVRKMPAEYLAAALFLAVLFVAAEGLMIWYLLRGIGERTALLRCISYSFIGFFFSGLTPSATGGQPMQLYYMKRDGNALSASSVVLMTVAVIYKLVLVLIGIAALVFWQKPLRVYLEEYFPLFLLGLALNTLLVAILLAVMLAPATMKRIISGIEGLLVRMRILPESGTRQEKTAQFIDGYQGAVRFLLAHKGKVLAVCLFTFVQRASVFVLTWIIYLGFSLEGKDGLTIMLLQASVYIAVDMLPVPGAQGITEVMYRGVFGGIFTGEYLMPSLYVTRGINFYFVLVVSLAVVVLNHLYVRRRKGGGLYTDRPF